MGRTGTTGDATGTDGSGKRSEGGGTASAPAAGPAGGRPADPAAKEDGAAAHGSATPPGLPARGGPAGEPASGNSPARNRAPDGPTRNRAADGPAHNRAAGGPAHNQAADGPARNQAADGPARDRAPGDGPPHGGSPDAPPHHGLPRHGPSAAGPAAAGTAATGPTATTGPTAGPPAAGPSAAGPTAAAPKPAPPPTAQPTNRILGHARWWALGAVLLTMFFSSLDQTVVSTALPTIVGDLRGFTIYAWVFTAYMMASAATVPIYGKLSDVYGRKPFYVFGLTVFMVGSALSGQSHDMLELILYRALQGIGAGAMLSMPRATIGDIFNPRERGSWMGVITMTFGLASIIGPFLGGWITDHWGWRWVFYINLPVAAAALTAILLTLPRVRATHRVRVDWRGSALLVLGLVPLLLGFTWAGSLYRWWSPQILGLFALAAAGLALFARVEARAPEPIIPMGFFRVRVFTTANLIGLLVGVGMFGTLMFLPVYIQGVLGMSAQDSGVVMTPMMLSFMAGSFAAGQIMTRTGRYKPTAVAAAVSMCAGFLLLERLGVAATWQAVVGDLLVMGLGVGALLPITNLAVQNAFPYRDMGVVSAAQQFVRSLAGVVAAPILGTVLASSFARHIRAGMPAALRTAVGRLPPAQRQVLANPQNLIDARAQAAIQARFEAFGAGGAGLYHQFIAAVRASLAAGMRDVFAIALVFALAALGVTFLLPGLKLKRDEFFDAHGGE